MYYGNNNNVNNRKVKTPIYYFEALVKDNLLI